MNRVVGIADAKPEAPKLQVQAGQALLELNETKRAMPIAERAVSLAPKDPEARLLRGSAYYRLGRYEEARKDAQEALKLDPQSKAAYSLLKLTGGRVARPAAGMRGQEQSGGRHGAAGTPARKPGYTVEAARMVEVDKKVKEAENLLRLGEPRKALMAAEAVLKVLPYTRAYLARGQAKLALEDAEGALEDAREAKKAGERDISVDALIARALTRLGRYGEAVEAASAALARSPGWAQGYLLRAQAREKAGAEAKAILEDYRRARDLDTRFAEICDQAIKRMQLQEMAQGPQGGLAAGLDKKGLSMTVIYLVGAASIAVLGLVIWVVRKAAA